MSERLTTAISPKAVTRQLSTMDQECDAAPPSVDIDLSRGPFGVFRLASSPVSESYDLPDPLNDTLLVRDMDENALGFSSGTLTPRTRSLFHSMLAFPEEDLSSSTMHTWDTVDDPSRVQEVFDDAEISNDISRFQSLAAMPEIMHDFPFNVPSYDPHIQQPCLADPMPLTIANDSVPQDAVILVKHYSTIVLTLLTPFRHSKTPWHVLFVPHAKSCLAALTLGEALDHASLAAFYATISISAFSLGGVTPSNTWLAQGNTYLNIAREHVRLMLRTAYCHPKAAKYKHVLIALLSMVQLAIVIGNRDQAECYFIEAEKFIRMKGLNRKKSRKVRLLHHCYVFERMFHESVYLAGTNSPHRSHVRKAIESSGATVYSQDSLSFRLGDLNDLESQMLRIKCREEGENDLHLQNPGFWPNTLYPEIFGIPEKYVFALSLVIRLGQWRDEAKHENAADALSLKEFLGRAKTVERYIKQLDQLNQDQNHGSTNQTEPSEPTLDNLIQAMQHALSIYFYRRIYDVEHDLLQKHVIGVRDCLFRSEAEGAGTMHGSARLLWPAFIAACEAEDPEVQETFTTWFHNSASRSGLRYFDNAKASIQRVWNEKRNVNGPRATWVDLMQEEITTHGMP